MYWQLLGNLNEKLELIQKSYYTIFFRVHF